MKPGYEPKTHDERLSHLMEEAAEVIAAAAKSQRFGLESYNPELPPEERETNRDWLLRELQDLARTVEGAINAFSSTSSHYIVTRRHGMIGDSMLFWRPNGAGYTTNIDEAGVYDFEEADRLCKGVHHEDVAIPCFMIPPRAQRHLHADSFNKLLGLLGDKRKR